MPGLPVSAHDWQVAPHALLQQTFWAQKPVAHSVPMTHIAPGGFLPQLPFTQVLGDTQSVAWVAVVQLNLHELVSHWNGSHGAVLAGRQTPAPSHVRACVSVDPVQLDPMQIVPAE